MLVLHVIDSSEYELLKILNNFLFVFLAFLISFLFLFLVFGRWVRSSMGCEPEAGKVY